MKNISEIISNKILGYNLDAQSEKDLQVWLDESEQNKETYEKIASGELSQIILEQNRLKLGDRLAKKILSRIRRKRRNIIASSISAAAAILILSLAILDTPQEVVVTVSATVQSPIKIVDESITLITAEGTKIEVKKTDEISTIIQNNAVTEVADTLRYAANTIVVPRAKEFNFELPDGTKVWLNSSSKLIFPTNFRDTIREVELVGEAFFDVTHNNKAPFIVKTKSLRTKVLGTKFMVTSYSDDCQVVLVSGSVNVSATDSRQFKLVPGEMVNFKAALNSFRVENIYINDILNRVGGNLIFNNIPLSDITDMLHNWYGVDFKFENDDIKHEIFYIKSLKPDSVEEILDLLKYTNKIDYIIDNNSVTIKSKLPMK